MIEKIKNEHVDSLFKAIQSLKNLDEYYKFFDDLCTIAEITEMSRRLQAAVMLDADVVYTDISKRTGLSTATISRVNKCLKYGSDGYKLVLKRMVETNIKKGDS